MTVTFLDGISPWTTVLRMAEAADRLRDLATEAEAVGRLGDATRATLAEARTLDLLLNLGAKGPAQLDYAADADAMEKAVTVLVRQQPEIGDRLAQFLRQEERTAYAARLQVYADKCRALPEHQVSENKEIPA